jgi:hypothetical protein
VSAQKANPNTPSHKLVRLELIQDKTLKSSELRTILKDNNIDYNMISKYEMAALMRLINTNMLSSHDDKALEYAGFCQFMV